VKAYVRKPVTFFGRVHLFTTIATLGTPRSATAQEIRVESFFRLIMKLSCSSDLLPDKYWV
jgi:hypothetical protein